MESEILQQGAFFLTSFLTIFVQLMFYAILIWVIASWLVLFGLISSSGRFFGFLTQMVYPILKPFQWARFGPVDLSPIVAILALNLAAQALMNLINNYFLA